MIKRYPNCIQETSNCESCSLSIYGKDCCGNPANPLAFYRKQKGLTQTELGAKIGTTKTRVSNWENGERSISTIQAITFIKIIRALDIPPEALLNLDE